MTAQLAATRPASFDALLLTNLPRLRKFARISTTSQEEAEDAINDMAVTAMAKWRSYRPDGSFYNWCKLMLRQRAFNAKAAVRGEHIEVENDNYPIAARQEGVAEAACIVREVYGLSKDSEIMMLAAVGYSQPEIGRAVGLSPERICQRLKRGRAELRSRLAVSVGVAA